MLQLKGTWVGSYSYDRWSEKLGDVPFQITIDFEDGDGFAGTVQDDPNNGGDPLPGKIKGRQVGNNSIEFFKEMPRHRYFVGDPSKMKERPGAYNIHNVGTQNSSDLFEGTWRIKGGLTFTGGGLMLSLRSTGKWRMSKVQADT